MSPISPTVTARIDTNNASMLIGGWALAIERHNEQIVASPILAKGNEVFKSLAKFVSTLRSQSFSHDHTNQTHHGRMTKYVDALSLNQLKDRLLPNEYSAHYNLLCWRFFGSQEGLLDEMCFRIIRWRHLIRRAGLTSPQPTATPVFADQSRQSDHIHQFPHN